MKYSVRLMVFVACWIFAVPVFGTNAKAADNVSVMGIYLSRKISMESTKRFFYKSERLAQGNDLYKRDFEAAKILVHRYDIETPLSQKEYPIDKFLADYETIIDREIDGLKFGETPLHTVASLAIGAGTTYLAKQGGPKSIFVGGILSKLAADKLGTLQVLTPKDTPALDARAAFEYGQAIQREIESGSELGKLLQKELKDGLGVTDVAGLANSAEYKGYVAEAEIAKSKGNQKYIEEKVTENFEKLAELHKEDHDLLLAIRNTQLEDEKRREAIELREKKQKALRFEAELIKAGFAGLELFAHIVGASQEEIQFIQLGGQATSALQEVFAAEASDPSTYASGYLALFKVGIAIYQLNQQRGENPFNAILEALSQISEQIADLRAEMNVRFDSVDGTLARSFAYQNDLLRQVLGQQAAAAEELAMLTKLVDTSQRQLLTAILKQSDRQNDVLWSKCNNGPDDQTIKDCQINGALMAIIWSYRDSVATRFEEFFTLNADPVVDADGSANFGALSGFDRIIPLYAKLRNNDPTYIIPNPFVWRAGAELYSSPFEQDEFAFINANIADLDKIISSGLTVQQFYRSAFTSELSTGNLKIATEWLSWPLENYIEAAKSFVQELESITRDKVVPWQGPKQMLPEEVPYVPEAQCNEKEISKECLSRIFKKVTTINQDPKGKKAKMILDPEDLPINNLEDEPRHAEIGRGIFLPDMALKRYKFLSEPLKLCPNGETRYALLKDPEKYFYKKSIAIDIKRLKTNGFKLDTSILPMIPTEVLWLERLNPNRFQIKLCVSDYFGQTGFGQSVSQWENIVPNKFKITVTMYIFDNETGSQVEFGNLHGGLKFWLVYNGPAQYYAGPYPLMHNSWNGFEKYNADIGPLAGKLDHFFQSKKLTPDQTKARSLISKLAYLQRAVAIEEALKVPLLSGQLKHSLLLAQQKLRILQGAYFLGGEAFGETSIAFHHLTLPVLLMTPEMLLDAFIDGQSGDKLRSRLNDQMISFRREFGRSDREITSPPATPVDASIDKLKLIRELVMRKK